MLEPELKGPMLEAPSKGPQLDIPFELPKPLLFELPKKAEAEVAATKVVIAIIFFMLIS
jgi:hypothetical protein